MNSGTRITVKTDQMSFVYVTVYENPMTDYSAILPKAVRSDELFGYAVDAIINDRHDVPYSLIDLPFDQPEVKEYEFFFKRLSDHSASTPNGRVGMLGRYDCKELSRVYRKYLTSEVYALKLPSEDNV